MDCLGCRIANGIEANVNVVYENEFVTCVLDIAPFNEGHLLILPKSIIGISKISIQKHLMRLWTLQRSYQLS